MSLEWKLDAQNKKPNYFSLMPIKFYRKIFVCIEIFVV